MKTEAAIAFAILEMHACGLNVDCSWPDKEGPFIFTARDLYDEMHVVSSRNAILGLAELSRQCEFDQGQVFDIEAELAKSSRRTKM
jgi:hypothetical protein